jgi:hypothetical protein
MHRALKALVLLLLPAMSSAALASEAGPHADPVASVALALVLVLATAKLFGELAVRLGQPAVLGELVAGVVLGNLSLLGYSGFEHLASDPSLDMLARLGVLVLLFEVGLESTVGQMLKVGGTAFLVAALGVVTPFGLGWAVSAWLLPSHSAFVHAFIGATLCATSVGITARVFQDLGRLQTQEARIILGAAVIDDVMGLIVLAVASSPRPTRAGAFPTEASPSSWSRPRCSWPARSGLAFTFRARSSAWRRACKPAGSCLPWALLGVFCWPGCRASSALRRSSGRLPPA